MRAVLDTNVLVSAVNSRGGPRGSIVRAWRKRDFLLVTSEALIQELEIAILRPHILERLDRTESERSTFIADLRENSIIVEPNERLEVIENDPADNKVLEAAVAGRVDFIVSGDAYLLALGAYGDIQILTQTRFAAVLTTPH